LKESLTGKELFTKQTETYSIKEGFWKMILMALDRMNQIYVFFQIIGSGMKDCSKIISGRA